MTSSMSGYTGPSSATGYNQIKGSRGATLAGDIIPKGYRKGQLQQFSPEQMQLFSQLFGHVGPESYLSKLAGGDEEAFARIEGPQMRQFQELLGGIGSRFSGMGGLGARHSSGFQNVTSSAAQNFAEQLASQRQDLQRQALSDLLGISESLLSQKPYETKLYEKQQKQPSGWSNILGAGLGGLGGFALGGPTGAATGATFGSKLMSGLF